MKGRALPEVPRSTEWLPNEAPPPRRRLGVFLRRALTVVLCFALGVALAAGALIWQGRNDLLGTRIAVNNLGEPPASEKASEEEQGLSKARTVLLVGSDSSDELSEDLADVATGERSGVRTDTIMLLRIDPETTQVTGISFPRDLLVTLCDGSQQKINAAVLAGGPNCLVKTLRDFAGVRIDHFVQVDFEGFVQIVKAVGGVTLYLEEPMNDPEAHLDLQAGCVTLNGRSALGFVRTRSDTDFGRIARQRRFLKELADEATSLDVVANPVRLFQMVDAVSEMLTVDDSLGVGTMRDFATTLARVESEDIHMATAPTISHNSPGLSYEQPIPDQTEDLVRAFKRGELAQYLGEEPPDKASEPPSDLAPKIPLDELEPIAVLNASDVNQLAAQTAEVLADAGVTVSTTGDAGDLEPARVRITYPAELKREAKALRTGAFPDAVLKRDASVDQVTVVLNSDFDPDLMDVAGAPEQEPSPPAIQEREFTNAEAPETQKDC